MTVVATLTFGYYKMKLATLARNLLIYCDEWDRPKSPLTKNGRILKCICDTNVECHTYIFIHSFIAVKVWLWLSMWIVKGVVHFIPLHVGPILAPTNIPNVLYVFPYILIVQHHPPPPPPHRDEWSLTLHTNEHIPQTPKKARCQFIVVC